MIDANGTDSKSVFFQKADMFLWQNIVNSQNIISFSFIINLHYYYYYYFLLVITIK
jgi:hypothetical protein